MLPPDMVLRRTSWPSSGWRSVGTRFHKGTMLCPEEPWLSASPDEILESGELLEIKCPLLKTDETLETLMSLKYDVKLVGGVPQLLKNGPRGFFVQVQLGMLCTGLRACKLLLWTPSQQVMLHVPFDEEFCSRTILRHKMFYFKYVLPFVAVEHEEGRLVFCHRYCRICIVE